MQSAKNRLNIGGNSLAKSLDLSSVSTQVDLPICVAGPPTSTHMSPTPKLRNAASSVELADHAFNVTTHRRVRGSRWCSKKETTTHSLYSVQFSPDRLCHADRNRWGRHQHACRNERRRTRDAWCRATRRHRHFAIPHIRPHHVVGTSEESKAADAATRR
jgi:hypothetical protein